MPRVPAEHTVPVASDRAYPWLSITGKPMSPSNTTDAPIIPVLAASKIPMNTTQIAKPPRIRPNICCIAVIIRSAIPLRSRSRPIKINIGNATSSGFLRSPPYMRFTNPAALPR